MKKTKALKEEIKLPPEKLEEREKLLQLCLGMDVLKAKKYAKKLNDEKFVELINQVSADLTGKAMKKPKTFPEYFYGKFYSIKVGQLMVGGSWEEARKSLLECLASDQGTQVKQVVEHLLHQPEYTADFSEFKARYARVRNALDKLLGYGLIKKTEDGKTVRYGLYAELAPLIRETLKSEEVKGIPVIRSDQAREELREIEGMDEEFDKHLKRLLKEKLEETIEFGKRFDVGLIADYLKEMFGPVLYFDHLLAIAQQYGLTDTSVLNPEGGLAMHTGFNLAIFGPPGTGKTFAISDMMRGDKRKNVLPHGLPGRNRYCGGMTAAKFIRIGEAYQDKRFNFIVPEFNDWFRTRGMVETLKLALEQGEIRYETKHESIGPYKFNSFFSTNYNVKPLGKFDFKVTIADPNFNAIEDRMLTRLHRMTRERYKEIAESARSLALGKMKMKYAEQIRDHLVLVYAIQTGHPLVRDRFKKKNVVVKEVDFEKIEEARNLILSEIRQEQVPFSARLERRALQLASALTIPSFFKQKGAAFQIEDGALSFAIKFFVEEVAVRLKAEVDTKALLGRLGVSEVNLVLDKIRGTKAGLQKIEDEEKRADLFGHKVGAQVDYLGRDFGSDPSYAKYEKDLRGELGELWEKLEPETKQFLVTSDILARAIDPKVILDYAPVVIGHSKAIENELLSKVFLAFKRLVEKGKVDKKRFHEIDSGKAGSFSGRELGSLRKTCGVFNAYLAGEGMLTLGHIYYILSALSKSSYRASPLLVEFKDFYYDESSAKGLDIERLNLFNADFRNRAAHSGVLSLEDSRKSREMILSKPKGLLFGTLGT